MTQDKKDADHSISAAKVVGTTLLGVGLATFTFFLSDATLPDDTAWWVHWAMAGASLASYAIGVAASVLELRKTAEDAIKSALERSERELQDRVAEKEHELQDLNAAHHEELDGLRHRVNELTTQLEAERDRAAKAAELRRALDAKERELESVKSVALSKSDIDALCEEVATLNQRLAGMEQPKEEDGQEVRPMTPEEVNSAVDECERKDQVMEELGTDECRALALLYEAETKGDALSESGLEGAFHSLWLKRMVVKNRSDRAAVGIEPSWLIADDWKSEVKRRLDDLRRRANG